MSAFGGGPGVEIPEGEPDALRGAAGAWEAAADVFGEQASTLSGTSSTALAADWHGPASTAYSGASTIVSLTLHDGVLACQDAATACRRLARELQDAQREAREAKRDAEDAIERGRKAEAMEAHAIAAAEAAALRAERSSLTALKARAAGPLGDAVAANAEADAAAASTEAQRASDDAAAYRKIANDAERDLEKARKRGERANRDARVAGRAAAAAFDAVAGAAQPPALAISPAVPVTVTERPNPLLGSPFAPLVGPPGRTPSDIRREQIALAADERRKAEEAREGGFDDAFGGMAKAWAGTDLGIGDPSTRAYEGNKRWNEALTFIPTPAGARAQLGRRVTKEAAEEVGEQTVRRTAPHGVPGALAVRRDYQFWKRTTTFDGTRVHQRDDLIDVTRVDGRGRTNEERMKRGLAPLGPDGKAIELHHTTQRHDGAVAEVTHEFHKKYTKELHINPNSIPSGIDRPAFDAWRKRYWSERLARLGDEP